MQGAEKYDRTIDPLGDSSVARILRWIKPSSSVLEMGPATGMMTKLLQGQKHCDTVCIEIDPNAAREAAPYCRKMIVGDLSSVDWEREIEGERFDYITFADVLEHLSDPLTVLRRALNFLKPEGEVLISVPNIGYVGVIAELLQGRFDYRRDGLLDETHLHFFTRKSLTELLVQAGLVGVEWSRTIINPEFSEFRLQTRSLGAATRGVLSAVPDGDTYQFLVKCSKSGVGDSFGSEPYKFDPKAGFATQVYFDTGGGFSEPDSITVSLDSSVSKQFIRCAVPEGVGVIRLDPIDAPLPFVFSSVMVKSGDNVVFNWKSTDGPIQQRSGLLNLSEIYSQGVSVLIPSSDDPALTILVDCREGGEFFAEFELSAPLKLNGIFSQFQGESSSQLAQINSLKEMLSSQTKEIDSLNVSLSSQTKEIDSLNVSLSSQCKETEDVRSTLMQVALELESAKHDIESHRLRISSIEESKRHSEETLNLLVGSMSWRLTRPLRVGRRILRTIPRYLLQGLKSRFKYVLQGLRSRFKALAKGGLFGVPWLLRSRLGSYVWHLFRLGSDYELRVARLTPSARELTQMREESLSKEGPVFSVILPTYKTKPIWLKQAIESVRSQAYPYWELCIADDASDSPAIRSLLTTYAANDNRIKVVFLSENGHISRASNAALELSTGEFVVLLDHDDLLAPHALCALSKAINNIPDTDVLYSDEDKVSLAGERFEPTCKPAWSPEYFLSFMYTGHISCFRAALVRDVGGFREGFEGSQDYDLMLRATERANRVQHIPEVLYHWRVHQDSVAGNLDSKPYAFEAAKRALLDALLRRGFRAASVNDSRSRGLYLTRRNAHIELSATIVIGESKATAHGFRKEVVKVSEGDIVSISSAINNLKLADSAVVCIVSGASFREEDVAAILDYFGDQAIGIVAPLIVDSNQELIAAGAHYRKGEIRPNFKGAKSSDIGYRGRLVAPFNVSFIYPQCFFLRASLLRTLPPAIKSTSELALVAALEAKRSGLRCVIEPSVQAVETTVNLIPKLSRTQISRLMDHYGMSEFQDPFLPAGLPAFQGLQEMPIS
jgi:glycosyltransferase involved in cell wall biosynthesis/2-polyprenyl-3-methyl-5-hydroxy-6-metoxy-1,4-benzoquinol methylase